MLPIEFNLYNHKIHTILKFFQSCKWCRRHDVSHTSYMNFEIIYMNIDYMHVRGGGGGVGVNWQLP